MNSFYSHFVRQQFKLLTPFLVATSLIVSAYGETSSVTVSDASTKAGVAPLPGKPSPMMGRQSHNEGVRAVPVPGPVKIDGVLSDWDLSGRIWSFADTGLRDTFSVETAAMWDKDYYYLAFIFRDATPLLNTINPVYDQQNGWKGDGMQMRVRTDGPQWISFWQYSEEERAVFHQAIWKDAAESGKGMDIKMRMGEPGGGVELGDGVQMAFRANEGGRGYVQEIRIPWSVIYKKVPKIEPGLTFQTGFEFFWGPGGESTWPLHRYADNMQPGETAREFFFSNQKAWGDVTLLAENNVEPLVYTAADEVKLAGTIPIPTEIPADAKEFTLVIETEGGERVRNLAAELNPVMYEKSISGKTRTIEVAWDGLDDHGQIVPPGTYRVRGLTHEGIRATYAMSFFNPGTPPWVATGSSGAWGADHGAPSLTARAGDKMIVGWHFAEGGHGVIGIGTDGLKKWGEKRGASAMAADDKNIYFLSSGWDKGVGYYRINAVDGAYKPFVLGGKERKFGISLEEIFGGKDKAPGVVKSMAASGKTVAMAFAKGGIALLDPASAEVRKMLDVSGVTAIAFGPDETLYAIVDGSIAKVSTTSGAVEKMKTPPFTLHKNNHALAIDNNGNIGIFDAGADQQVKFFTPEGKLTYAVGKKGGRPVRGKFEPEAMREVSSIAVDKDGNIWATELWEFPRRVSVWNRDGLVRDYIGNTGYAATGAFLHDEDPDRAFYGMVEMKLDRAKRTWDVTEILWVPEEGEPYPINVMSHAHPHVFTSKASGEEREYAFVPPYRASEPHLVLMKGKDGWRPVAALGLLGGISGKIEYKDGRVIRQPDGEFEGRNAWDAYFWNDSNADGKIQFEEVTIVPNEKPVEVGKTGSRPIGLLSGWGARMSPDDLAFLTYGVVRYKPLRFTAEGAPVYGLEGMQKLAFKGGNGDLVEVPGTGSLIAMLIEKVHGTKGLYGVDIETGKTEWSYPNPYAHVHASHQAPMPAPGLLIGVLKVLGIADLPEGNGKVFGMRGNLGQDYFLTTDGLFVSSMFQDGRLPDTGLPNTEEALVGAAMENHSGGGEPFAGWFGQHKDGKYRLLSGIPRQTAMILEIDGFDTIKRFEAPPLKIDATLLAKAALDNAARAEALAQQLERNHTITKVAAPLPVDGRGGEAWAAVPKFKISSSASNYTADAQLAYDSEFLYLAMDVDDQSPWVNTGADIGRLFKTGDAVDIQFAAEQSAKERIDPVAGDFRVVMAPQQKGAAAVLMRPVSPGAPAGSARLYTSPVGEKKFDEVRPLNEVKIEVRRQGPRYRIEAALPLAALGLTPKAGAEISGDIGFISSDAGGLINTARTYWSDHATNLVNDEPLEAWLSPLRWGSFTWGK